MGADWQRVSTNDGQTFVYAETGEGPLVLMFHGFPDTPEGTERIAAEVAAAGYRVVRPWLRGYHPETLVEGRPYDRATIGQDAIRLLDALGEDKAVLIGHDWGAAVVYSAAAQAPERWRAFVPIAIPHPSLVPRDPKTVWAARHFITFKLPWGDWVASHDDFAYIETCYRRWSPDWDDLKRDACLASVKRAFSDPACLHASLDYYRAVTPKLDPEALEPIPVRALVVGGSEDILSRELYEQTAASKTGAGSRAVILDGAGHWPHLEREDEFISALLGYLGEL
jgi:pimeloyl-ACP methyl ester carboxylesterase